VYCEDAFYVMNKTRIDPILRIHVIDSRVKVRVFLFQDVVFFCLNLQGINQVGGFDADKRTRSALLKEES